MKFPTIIHYFFVQNTLIRKDENIMSKKDVVIETVTEIMGSKGVQKFLLGTYSDGKPRSLPDALKDEIRSPKQRMKKKKVTYDDLYKKKNKKKKKKRKNSYKGYF